MEEYKFGRRRPRRGDYEVPDSDEDEGPSKHHKQAPAGTPQIETPASAQAELSASHIAAQAGSAAPQADIAAPADPVTAPAKPIATLAAPAAALATNAAPAAPATDSDSGSEARRRRGESPRVSHDQLRLTVDGRLVIEGVPKEVSASLERLVRQAPSMINQAQGWMATNPRFRGMVDVRQQLPQLPLNATWTAKHRERVERSWIKDPKRERLLATHGQKDLLTLYKACLRLVHCLPEDIISCRFNLEYDMDQNRRIVFWSSQFCKTLKALLVHPMWDGSVALLAIAIQYAVIAETNDSGPWDMEPPPGCDKFLRSLLHSKKSRPSSNTIEYRRDLHDRMSVFQPDMYGRPTGGPTSLWDLLFQELEDAAEKERATKDRVAKDRAARGLPDAEPPPRPPRSGPFLVRQQHLKMLEDALNAMSYKGLPRFLPVDSYNYGIGGRRSDRDFPQQGDLRELRSWSISCERERVAYKELLGSSIAAETQEPQAGNEAGPVDSTQSPRLPSPLPAIPAVAAETQEEAQAANEAGPAELSGSRITDTPDQVRRQVVFETPDRPRKKRRARPEDPMLPALAPWADYPRKCAGSAVPSTLPSVCLDASAAFLSVPVLPALEQSPTRASVEVPESTPLLSVSAPAVELPSASTRVDSLTPALVEALPATPPHAAPDPLMRATPEAQSTGSALSGSALSRPASPGPFSTPERPRSPDPATSPRPSDARDDDGGAHGADDDSAGNGNVDDIFAMWDCWDPRDAGLSPVNSLPLPALPGLADVVPPCLRPPACAHAGDPSAVWNRRNLQDVRLSWVGSLRGPGSPRLAGVVPPPLRPPATRQEP